MDPVFVDVTFKFDPERLIVGADAFVVNVIEFEGEELPPVLDAITYTVYDKFAPGKDEIVNDVEPPRILINVPLLLNKLYPVARSAGKKD
jgi:hypothetical protein